MLLPTNDGFVALNGPRVRSRSGHRTFHLRSYDAGTEANDEVCTSIPGPQCDGEGFNAADGEGFVAPHAGLHGEGELSRMAFNWGEPVARVTVRQWFLPSTAVCPASASWYKRSASEGSPRYS